MKNILQQFIIIFVTVSLIGCASQTRKQNTGIGVVIGTAMGGFTGNPVFMFPIGIMAGMAGYMMESSDDKPKYKKLGGDEKVQSVQKKSVVHHVDNITYQPSPKKKQKKYTPTIHEDSSRLFDKSL